MKYLIGFVLIQYCVMGQIQVPPDDGLDLFNNMMKYLFDNCKTEFGTIGFWSDVRIFLADNEFDYILLNKTSEVFHKQLSRRIKVLVVILDTLTIELPKIEDLYAENSTLEIETMFVFSKYNLTDIKTVSILFIWFQNRFENSRVYYCTATEGYINVTTLNAFADVAPIPWVKIDQVDFYDYDKTTWTIFNCLYDETTPFNFSPDLCKNIFFDRTKQLNGYKIRGMAIPPGYKGKNLLFFDQGLELSKLGHMEQVLATLLIKYLNVSLQIVLGMPIYHNPKATTPLIDGFVKFSLSPLYWLEHHKNCTEMTHFYESQPISFIYDIIVTNNRGLSSPLEKMFEFYGWLTIIATLIILFITFMVIYFANSENSFRLSFAIFDCLRLLVNNSIYTRMNTTKMRIFFFVIFLYFLIIQATFSGHLAAFLTKPVYRKNVESLEELKDFHYSKIYARDGAQGYITDKVLLNKTEFVESQLTYICEKSIENTSIACIDNQNSLISLIIEYNLHTPKNYVMFTYSSMLMSHNWALRHRVNNLIMWLAQSGISNRWEKNRHIGVMLEKWHDSMKNYFRPIEVEDVKFTFVLLTVGLFFSSFCFAIECSINMIMMNKTNLLSYLSKVKRYIVFIVRLAIFEFSRLLEWFYNILVRIINWMHRYI